MSLCRSHLNVYNPDKRCNRQVVEGQDFCRYHIRTKKYLIPTHKYLEDNCSETLFDMYEWKDVPENYWIQLNNRWWDIRILVNIMAEQLSFCDMEAPAPKYPHDPFDKRNFNEQELERIGLKCKENNIVKEPLTYYIDERKYDNVIMCEHGTTRDQSYELTAILRQKFRFKLVNSKNSQECYQGVWVPKKTPLSKFEKMYAQLDDMPMYTYVPFFGEIMAIPSAERAKLIEKIEKLPIEQY